MDKLPPRVKLFPPHEPFNEGMLKVSEIHTIHYEERGNHFKSIVNDLK